MGLCVFAIAIEVLFEEVRRKLYLFPRGGDSFFEKSELEKGGGYKRLMEYLKYLEDENGLLVILKKKLNIQD